MSKIYLRNYNLEHDRDENKPISREEMIELCNQNFPFCGGDFPLNEEDAENAHDEYINNFIDENLE